MKILRSVLAIGHAAFYTSQYRAHGLVTLFGVTLFGAPVGADKATFGAKKLLRVVWGWGLGFLSARGSGHPPLIRFSQRKIPPRHGQGLTPNKFSRRVKFSEKVNLRFDNHKTRNKKRNWK